MSAAIAALLISLGCAPASFTGPAGEFLVWVCPPIVEESEAPTPPPAPAPAPTPTPAPAPPGRDA
jgi:hypothetical protein